jgi:hypothetical protein
MASSHIGYVGPYSAATYGALYDVAPQGSAAYGVIFYAAPPASEQMWDPSPLKEWVFDSGITAHLSRTSVSFTFFLHILLIFMSLLEMAPPFLSPPLEMPLAPLFYLIVHFILAMFLLHLA